MPSYLQVAVILIASGFLAWVMVYDFKHLKVTNRSVLIVLALYAVWAGLGRFATTPSDLVAAGILFGLGLIMWLFRAMGAGDAKLYFGLGLLIGFRFLMVYAFLLVLTSFAFYVLLVIAKRSGWSSGVGGRLAEFAKAGRVPYAVPICLSAIPAILLRTFSGF